MCKLCMLSEWPTILNIFLLLPYTIITVKKILNKINDFLLKSGDFLLRRLLNTED